MMAEQGQGIEVEREQLRIKEREAGATDDRNSEKVEEDPQSSSTEYHW